MISDYYTESFSVLQVTKTSDGVGGKTESWSVVSGSAFKGKKMRLSANEYIANQSHQYKEQWKILCPTSVSATRANMIRATDGDYEILSTPENKWGHHLVIIIGKD